jgi:hypothetical protein
MNKFINKLTDVIFSDAQDKVIKTLLVVIGAWLAVVVGMAIYKVIFYSFIIY